MSYWFFLSYARKDNELWSEEGQDGPVKKFYDALCREIAGRRPVRPDEVGFFDSSEIGLGESWPDALTSALQQSRVFVSLFSPSYFNSEYCGREWAVFSARVEAYAKKLGGDEKPPALMFPVLWESENDVKKALPESLSHVNYKTGGYDKKYTELGLRSLVLDQKRYEGICHDFIKAFANGLIEAVEKCELPALDDLQSIKVIPPTFPATVSQPSVKAIAHPGESGYPGDRDENSFEEAKKSWWLKNRKRIVIAASLLALVFLFFGAGASLIERVFRGSAKGSIPVFQQGKLEEEFNEGNQQWMPEGIGWGILRKVAGENRCRYRVIGGGNAGFFKATDSNGAVYQYRNFRLVMDVRLSDYCPDPTQFDAADRAVQMTSASPAVSDRKIAWVVRAQDDSNYYLFELTLAPSGQGKYLNFFIREAGAQRQIGSGRELPYVRYDMTSSFNIVTEAKDNDFTVTIAVTGSTDEISAQFKDTNGKFKEGKIGFPPIKDNQLFLQTFWIEGPP